MPRRNHTQDRRGGRYEPQSFARLLASLQAEWAAEARRRDVRRERRASFDEARAALGL